MLGWCIMTLIINLFRLAGLCAINIYTTNETTQGRAASEPSQTEVEWCSVGVVNVLLLEVMGAAFAYTQWMFHQMNGFMGGSRTAQAYPVTYGLMLVEWTWYNMWLLNMLIKGIVFPCFAKPLH
jgi:hypothetical protein